MADPRFFAPVGPFTLGELADRTGAEIAVGGDCALTLHDVASLATAGPQRVRILPDVRIGQEGFGLASHPAGHDLVAGHVLVPHLGRVRSSTTSRSAPIARSTVEPGRIRSLATAR